MVLQGDDILRIFITDVEAVKPGLLRVSAYLSTEEATSYYSVIIPAMDFTENKVIDGKLTIEINIDKFQHEVTKAVFAIQDTGNLAGALNNELHWEVRSAVEAVEDAPESAIDGLDLAFGEKE